MIDFLVSILEANINFETIGAFILIYFASIWILFCLWVFIDSKRRFEKNSIAVAFFFIVLIFNFPGLIFYLIIRPDKNEDHYLYLQNNEIISDQESKGGIDVPIVNFIGENGEINLSFQLRVNKSLSMNNIVPNIQAAAAEGMQVNVELPSTIANDVKSSAVVVEPKAKLDDANLTVVKSEIEESKGVKISFSTIKAKFLPKITALKSNFVRNPQPLKVVEVDIQNSNPQQSDKNLVVENSSKSKIRSAFQKTKKGNNKKKKRRK